MILCTICARGGSKGLPGKNIKPLLGKALINHTVEMAITSGLFDYIAVSSDSEEILSKVKMANNIIKIKRPDDLASDQAGKIPTIVHSVDSCEKLVQKSFRTIIDLDVTSPLRLVSDIVGCYELFKETQCDNVITASPSRKSPYFNLVELDKEQNVRLSKQLESPVLRRQDAPKCFDMNASIYVWDRNIFMNDPKVFYDKTKLFEMPEERSIDIDTELDFKFVEFLMSSKTKEKRDHGRL